MTRIATKTRLAIIAPAAHPHSPHRRQCHRRALADERDRAALGGRRGLGHVVSCWLLPPA